MSSEETTRPARKYTPEEIEAIRARKRAKAAAEAAGVEEVTRKKRTPEEIEALRAKKRARELAEADAIAAAEAEKRKKRAMRQAETDTAEEPVRKKRTPEEIEALRAKKRARELAEAEAVAAAEAEKRKKRAMRQAETDTAEEPVRKKRTPEEIEALRAKKRARLQAEAAAKLEEESEPVTDGAFSGKIPQEDTLEKADTKKFRSPGEEAAEEEPDGASETEEVFPGRAGDDEEEGYEKDLGSSEDDDDFDYEDDFDDEDELESARRTKQKEHKYTWLLILLLVLLLLAVSAFAYLITGTRAIGVEKESLSMLLGDELTVEPVFTPSFARDKSYTIYSENPDVVTVTENGTLVAVAEGVATLSFVQNGTLYGTCPVTVGPVRVSGITIEDVPETVLVGESFTPTLSYVPENATHPELELSISDDTVASLENGTVTALEPGLVTFTATNSHSGITKSVEVAVLPVEPTAITLNLPETATYGVDVVATVTFEPEDTTYAEVTLTSSDPSIVEIDGMALVPKGVGTVTITAEHSCGVTTSKEITVYPEVIITPKTEISNTLAVKKRAYLLVSLNPEGETGTIEWSSSNTAVATVSNKGQVKGISGGDAVITAKLASGATGTYAIHVPAEAQKCKNHEIIKGTASRKDVIEFVGMADKNTVVKLDCVDDPEKSCMLLVAKSGAMTTTKETDAKGKTTLTTSSKSYRVKIPAATYNVKLAFGDTWYGDALLFGEEGEYYDLHITFTAETDGSFGISSLSRSKNKEAVTMEDFLS